MSDVYTRQDQDHGFAESSHEIQNFRVALVTHTGDDGKTYTKVWLSDAWAFSHLVANIDMETGKISTERERA